MEETPQDMGTGKTPDAQAVKARWQWDHGELRNFCTAKGTERLRRQPSAWEEMHANSATHRGPTSRIYEELQKVSSRLGVRGQ